MTVLVTLGTWNEGCFRASAPSFRLQIQLTDVLIQQGHHEKLMPVVLTHGSPGAQRKSNIPPAGPPPFGVPGAVASRRPPQIGTSIVPPKTSVAIGQSALAIRLYDAISRRIGAPRCR